MYNNNSTQLTNGITCGYCIIILLYCYNFWPVVYDCEVSSTSSTSSTSSNTANTAGSTSSITASTAGTASSINNLFLSATDRRFILTTTTTTTTVRISISVIVKGRERGRSTLWVLNPVGG